MSSKPPDSFDAGSWDWSRGSLDHGAPSDAAAVDLPPEQPGRYRPADGPNAVIGRGGIGIVFAIWDEVLQREVACKVLASGATSGPQMERFLREARATAGLQHPGIVPVHDLGMRPGGLPYYTMKYVRGRTLAAAIASCAGLAERLRLLGAFVDVCQAIAYAHEHGVLHRDVKPANVMLGEFGETVVLDWGLARLRGEAASAPGAVVGTPVYMSPEQAAGERDGVDEGVDIWSLGVVLFEILAGRPPYTGDAAEVLRLVRECGPPPLLTACPEAPRELAAIVDKALARVPEGRYAHSADLAADVDAYRSGVPVAAYAYSSIELVRRFLTRHRGPVTIIAVAATVLLAVGVSSFVRVVAERNRAQAAEGLALAREHEALDNLADALAEKALGTPEIEPFTAEIYAAGALAGGERPEARGVIARAERRWTPSLLATRPTPYVCRALTWLDANRLACLSDERLIAWEFDGTPRFDIALEKPAGRNDIVVSPDGRRIALALSDGLVWVLDAATGALVRRLTHEAGLAVKNVVFSADGRTLYAALHRDTVGHGIVAWDVETGERRGAGVSAVYPEWLTRAPDGMLWMSVRGFGTQPAGILEVDPVRLTAVSYRVGSASTWGEEWSPDGRWLAAAGGDGRTLVWGPDGAAARSLGGEGGLGTVRWSPDSQLLAHGREDGSLTLWRVGAWQPLLGIDVFPLAWRSFSFSPDGARMAVAAEKSIGIWRLGALPPEGGLFDGSAMTVSIRVAADGGSVIGYNPYGVARWDLRGAALRELDFPDSLAGCELSPDGASLVVATSRGVDLRDADSGVLFRALAQGAFRGAGFADGGKLAVGLGEDGVVSAWDSSGAGERWHTAADYAYLFVGTDGPALALAKTEGVDLLSPADGSVRRLTDGVGVFFADLSQNGHWAVLTWTDGHVSVVDTAAAREVDQFIPYGGLNRRVTISEDGRWVAAGGADAAIRIWDREAGALVAILRGHRKSMQDLAFSPDARLLLSTAWGDEARSWDLSDLRTPGATLLERAERRSNLRLQGAKLVAARP